MSNTPPVVLPTAVLDAGFGGNGRVSLPVGTGEDQALGVAVLANGGLVLAGSSDGTGGGDLAIVHLKEDGTADTAFSGDGKLTIDVAGGDDAGADVAVLSDGRIVVVGTANVGTTSDIVVVRCNADGTLDTSFDGDGMRVLSLSPGQDEAAAVALQADNKSLVLATSNAAYNAFATARLALIRFNADGSLDTGFGGGDGIAEVNFEHIESAAALAVQADGRILVAGHVWDGLRLEYDLIVARFNADGSLDTSFSGDGMAQIDLGSAPEFATALALDADGRILLAGSIGPNGITDALLVRLTAAGDLDPGFGGDGVVTFNASTGNDTFNSVVVLADGSILAGGRQATGYGEALLARFAADGTLDTSFAGDGSYSLMFENGTSAIYDLAVAADGQVVAAGDSFTGNANDFGVVKLAAGVADQAATAGSAFSYQVPDTTFFDADGDVLSYSASLASGGALPAWLSFDATTRTFQGTPQAGDLVTSLIAVTASDGTASVAADFQLEVTTNFIEALRFTNHFRWNADVPNGTPGTVLSFSFMETAGGDEAATFTAMSPTQRQAVRDVLQSYSDIAGVAFAETADGGQIQLGNYLESGTNTAGYTATAWDATGTHSTIWINRDFAGYDTPAAGDSHYETLLHEVGHALGLKHPGNYGGGDPPYLSDTEDTTQYTVMSYVSRADDWFLDVPAVPATSEDFHYSTVCAATPMLYDVAAIQFLYGANSATHAEDTTYAYDAAAPFFATLWDGGGNDTINVGGFTTDCTIDLRPGSFSSLRIPSDPIPSGWTVTSPPTYYGSDNLAIAYGTLIENAVGGSGNDVITGNDADNRLAGGGGSNVLDGGGGTDYGVFAGNRSAYNVSQDGAAWTVAGAEGTTTLNNVERLAFADQTVTLIGNTPDVLAYHWSSHALLADVAIAGGGNAGATGADGAANLSGIAETSLALTASRAVTPAEHGAVDGADVTAVLRLLVGLDVNAPGRALSPYQALAADYDGDGAVGIDDAVGIARHAAGLAAADPAWKFVEEDDATIPGLAPLAPGLPPALAADFAAAPALRLGLAGYLTGDVDGSYAGPGGAAALDASYFVSLVDSHPTLLSLPQFGIYT